MFDGLFRLLGYERRDARLSHWSPELAEIFGAGPTAAGVAVTAETALRSPTFLACMRVIAETLSALPIHVFERETDGARRRNSDHAAAQLLSGDWCPWESGVATRTALQFDAMLHGAGYAEVLRASGRPREIHRLDPRTTTMKFEGGEPFVETGGAPEKRRIDWRDVLYVATPGSALGRPLCLVTLLREAIGLDLVMAQHQARIFSNGARPAGILKAGKHPLTKEQMDFLSVQFSKHYNGANSGRTLILEDDWAFQQLQFTSVDLQFLELRRLASQDIARGCKVPGTLVGDLDRATWRNVEELSRVFLQTCLIPWIEVWIPALSRVLLTPIERQTMFVEFIVEDLLRGDMVGRFAAYRNAVGGSWLTPNEVRKLENRPPVDGGDDLIRQAGQSGPEPEPSPAPSPIRAVA